jgi:hypothetical protein
MEPLIRYVLLQACDLLKGLLPILALWGIPGFLLATGLLSIQARELPQLALQWLGIRVRETIRARRKHFRAGMDA